jgi:hypothetical protein
MLDHFEPQAVLLGGFGSVRVGVTLVRIYFAGGGVPLFF